MARPKKRPTDEDEDGDFVSGPVDTASLEWARERWRSQLQHILDGLEVTDLDEPSRLLLQRKLWVGHLLGQDRSGHVVMVLRCICESECNGQAALNEMNLKAVAGAIGPFEDRGLALLECFDQIDLIGTLKQMKALGYFYASEATEALARIVGHKLQAILCAPQPAPPPKLTTKQQREADKLARSQMHARLIERKLALGCQLASLRDVTPNNHQFGMAIRKQFGIDDKQGAAEMMRIARMYSHRPEIFRNAANWRVLAALASTILSAERRSVFERRIAAGESVTAAEIERAQAHTPRSGSEIQGGGRVAKAPGCS